MEEFNKGAFSFLIMEDMPRRDVAALKERIEGVEHVETVLWYDSLALLAQVLQIRYQGGHTGDKALPACDRPNFPDGIHGQVDVTDTGLYE